jgi:hypothetical protein
MGHGDVSTGFGVKQMLMMRYAGRDERVMLRATGPAVSAGSSQSSASRSSIALLSTQ